MALATWWADDFLPELEALDGFEVRQAGNDELMAWINGISEADVRSRRAAGHRPYIASVNGTPAAYGWVATQVASIGELDVTISLPARTRYLWDFGTCPTWQGRGLYPRLLQAIVKREQADADQLWIIFAPENLPSGAGIERAGFTLVGDLSFGANGVVGLAGLGERAQAGAALLGIALTDKRLAPCWCCQQTQAEEGAACWPTRVREVAHCTCAVTTKSYRDLHTVDEFEQIACKTA